MADIRVPFGVAQAAFGVPAIVTLSGQAPVAVTAVWSPPVAVEVPGGMDSQRVEMRKVISLPIDLVPIVPAGTAIEAAERDGDVASTWRVDGAVYKDVELTRVTVVPASEES